MQEETETTQKGLSRRQFAYLALYVLGLVIASIFIHEAAHIVMALIKGVPFGEMKIGFWGINPSVTLPQGLDESVKTPIFYAGGFTTGVLLVMLYFIYWVRKYHREAAKTSFRHREEGEARRGDLLRPGTFEFAALTSLVRKDDSDGIEAATPAPQARRDEEIGHRENCEINSGRSRLTWALGLATIALAAVEFANGYLEGRYHGAYLYGATTLLSPTHLLTIGWILSAVVLHLGMCPRKKLVYPAES